MEKKSRAEYQRERRALATPEQREKRLARMRGYYARNQDKMREYHAAYEIAHRDELNAQARARYAKNPGREQWKKRIKKYGISEQAFAEHLDAQEGACALCGEQLPESVSRISIDHDHSTGAVRGLVHQGCNVAIGAYEKHRAHLEGYLN